MNFKTKALFLFGILLFGLGLSYFLGATFMEGFDTPPGATPVTTPVATPVTTPVVTTPVVTTPVVTTPIAPAVTPASKKPKSKTTDTSTCWDWLRKLGGQADAPKVLHRPSDRHPSYDNYNHYNAPHKLSSTQYYGSTGTPINPLQGDDKEVPAPNSSVKSGVSKDYGTQYYSAMPPGVPASQILPGDEHLYILKSEIVPPVCPVCPAFPSASAVNNTDAPPPCPPCGRCPEASFECKKVPNYNATNSDSMPVPVLNDFSSFGM